MTIDLTCQVIIIEFLGDKMTLEEVNHFYGTSYQFNKKTGMHHACYGNWRKQGFIPIRTQIFLEQHSQGKLKASLSHLQNKEK